MYGDDGAEGACTADAAIPARVPGGRAADLAGSWIVREIGPECAALAEVISWIYPGQTLPAVRAVPYSVHNTRQLGR